MGLYDNVLAQERENVALEAANMAEGRGSVYLAAKGGERMRQGARSMFGIEEPAVIAAKAQKSKQAQLQGIMSKYATASTREQFTAAFSELMANGFPEQAAKVQEHLKNMPKPEAVPDNLQLYQAHIDAGGTGTLQEFIQSIKGKGVTVNTGDQSSVGWNAIDKAYGQEFLDWNRDSGDMIGQLAQLESVLTKLEQPDADLTGAVIGLAPEWYTLLTNPDAIGAKERVAEVVQRNLKLILGGQFSEKEGKQLIDRAYNPGLDEKENIARLKRLILQMQAGVEARNAMNDYFSTNGTLKGYEGVRVSKQSFFAALNGIQPGEIRGKYQFIDGDPADQGNWKLMEDA
jgi:hypothetical protein